MRSAIRDISDRGKHYALTATSVTSSIVEARAIFNLAHGHDLIRAACGCADSERNQAR